MTPQYGYSKVDIEQIMKRRGFDDKGILVMILVIAGLIIAELALWCFV